MKRLAAVLIAIVLVIPVGALAQSRLLAGPPKWVAHPPIRPRGPAQSTLPGGGYSPSQIYVAYGLGALEPGGSGQVIAIIDAYDDPTIASDLQTFSSQFGLHGIHTSGCTVTGGPHPCFQKATPQGKPKTDGGWAFEISLDVEWAHAIAPLADILLVEARNSSLSNLMGAVQFATGTTGVRVVSMSWGGGEFSGESSYDQTYFYPGISKGIMFTASTGDGGAFSCWLSGTCWPSVSPYVLAVGGTTLCLDAKSGTRTTCPNQSSSEIAWSGSGGGISAGEAEPGYQTAYGISTGGYRGVPDVAFDADPSTGVYIYDSTPYNGTSGWSVVGGTSVGAPSWAALIALANSNAKGPLYTSWNFSPIYTAATGSTNYSANFNDITSGDNGWYSAGPGYDLVTGLGSPKANSLVPFLYPY